MNSRAGRYVNSHPVVALALLLFATLALLPVGLFLVFALVTLAVSVAGFVAVEGKRKKFCRCCLALITLCPSSSSVLLLLAGGLSLLGVLCGVAMFSVVVSLVFNGAYAVIFNVLGYSHPVLAQVLPTRVVYSCSDGHIYFESVVKKKKNIEMKNCAVSKS